MDAIEEFVLARETVTGVALPPLEPDLEPRCPTAAEFKAVVSDYNKMMREVLAQDIRFLSDYRPDARLREVNEVLYQLRTAHQHADAAAAAAFEASWVRERGGYQRAADALAALMSAAFSSLAERATQAMRDDAARDRWADVIATDTAAILQAVVDDLGLRLRRQRFEYHRRNVDLRRKVRPSRGPQNQIVQDFCVQELLAQHGTLPVACSTVLTQLRVLGGADAVSAAMTAYAVAAAAPHLEGDDFLDRVAETFEVARGGRRPHRAAPAAGRRA